MTIFGRLEVTPKELRWKKTLHFRTLQGFFGEIHMILNPVLLPLHRTPEPDTGQEGKCEKRSSASCSFLPHPLYNHQKIWARPGVVTQTRGATQLKPEKEDNLVLERKYSLCCLDHCPK